MIGLAVFAMLISEEPSPPEAPTTAESAEVAPPTTSTPPMNARKSTTREVGRLYDPKKRAEGICSTYGEEFRCGGERMKRFNVVETATIDAPVELEVSSALGGHKDKPCVVAVNVVVSHPTQSITVDWQRVAIDVNRIAMQAVPGFARQTNSGLIQRPSTASPGAILAEGVFVVDGVGVYDACIMATEPKEESSTVTVRMPIDIGGHADEIVFRHVLQWESIDERAVIELLPVGHPLPPPERPITATLVGAGAGFLVPSACGLVVGLSQTVGSEREAAISIGGGLLYGLLCGGLGAGAGWAFGDLPEWERADDVEAKGLARDALLKKRRDLGIDPAPTTPLSASGQ